MCIDDSLCDCATRRRIGIFNQKACTKSSPSPAHFPFLKNTASAPSRAKNTRSSRCCGHSAPPICYLFQQSQYLTLKLSIGIERSSIYRSIQKRSLLIPVSGFGIAFSSAPPFFSIILQDAIFVSSQVRSARSIPSSFAFGNASRSIDVP